MLKSMDDKAKKMLFILIGMILFVIVFVIILFLINRISGSNLSYSELEKLIVEKTKLYVKDKSEVLPLNENDEVQVDISTLVNQKYMKEVTKYLSDNNTCTGFITITKSNDYYNYSPYIECGDKYKSSYLYEKLIENIVSSDSGLYKTSLYYNGKENSDYVFKGEYPNNYIMLNNRLWRIIKIDDRLNIEVTLASYDSDNDNLSKWDNRYNVKTNAFTGIKNYYESRVRNNVNKFYLNDLYLSDDVRSKIVPQKLCINSRNTKSKGTNGSIECKVMSDYQDYLYLLSSNTFMNASLDKNCNTLLSKSCGNYNYLAKFGYSWWIITPGTRYDNYGLAVDSFIYEMEMTYDVFARFGMTLTKNTIYSGGTGTKTDPYIIK